MPNGPISVEQTRGLLLIVSGPSGSGKSTLVADLVRLGEFPLVYSVSATSRPPRPGEIDGVHYRFLSRQEFETLRDQGEFLESAEVYGNLYGTPRGSIEQSLAQGQWVILDIDPEGHRQIKACLPEAISFFIRAASLADYAARLRSRKTESEASIAKRMTEVQYELSRAADYDFQIMNETIDQAMRTFRTLLWGLWTLKKRG